MSGSESSTWIRTFPDWSDSSGHRVRMTRDAHDGGDSPRKTTTGPKSGLKIKICIKFKQFGSSGSRRVRIRASRIRDSDPDLNPDPGLLDGISPGNGSVSGRWIRPGLRYHQQGPGHNIRWDRSVSAALATLKEIERVANTRTEKRQAKTKEKHT